MSRAGQVKTLNLILAQRRQGAKETSLSPASREKRKIIKPSSRVYVSVADTQFCPCPSWRLCVLARCMVLVFFREGKEVFADF
jgi:hypothetical protein